MHMTLVIPHMRLEVTVEVVVVQLNFPPFRMADLQLPQAVQTELVTGMREVEVDLEVERSLVVVAVALGELALMPELEPVEMVAVERMLFPLG
jgi:hypothetical protein